MDSRVVRNARSCAVIHNKKNKIKLRREISTEPLPPRIREAAKSKRLVNNGLAETTTSCQLPYLKNTSVNFVNDGHALTAQSSSADVVVFSTSGFLDETTFSHSDTSAAIIEKWYIVNVRSLPALFEHGVIRCFPHHLVTSVGVHLVQHLVQQRHQRRKLHTHTHTHIKHRRQPKSSRHSTLQCRPA